MGLSQICMARVIPLKKTSAFSLLPCLYGDANSPVLGVTIVVKSSGHISWGASHPNIEIVEDQRTHVVVQGGSLKILLVVNQYLLRRVGRPPSGYI